VLQDCVLDTITRHRMFSPGQRAGVAVSGGADSVCLLHLLHELAPHWNLRLSVIHIDHGIRGALSQADADFVGNIAKSFALPFHFRSVDVPAIDDNLEQAARRVRMDFFRELADSGTVDRIATGHTRSDQAETVLYRVLRGSGLDGLSGIRPITQQGIVRPLLYTTRAEVRAWLQERKIEWREDETNENRAFDRNRIRHELLPQLRRDFNPQLDDALANLAEIARDEEEGRRVVRQAIEGVKGDLRQIGFQHVEAILKLARSAEGHGRVQVPGVDVFRSFEWIRFAPAGHDMLRATDFAVPIDPPQTVEIPGGGGQVEFQVVERQESSAVSDTCDRLIVELDWKQIRSNPALELRNWRAGDSYRRVGQTHEQKLKLLFQQARIPLWERSGWPVLAANGRIVWCRRFGPAEDFAPGASTRTILRIRDTNRRGS
jgi:tRNA(Ile)-lysidine synthase